MAKKKIYLAEKAEVDAVEEEISQVGNAIGKEAIPFPVTEDITPAAATDIAVIDDGIWHKGRFTGAGVYNKNDYAWYTKVSCASGKDFSISSAFYGNGWYCVSAWKNGSLVKNYLEGGNGAYKQYTDERLVIDVDADYIVVQCGTGLYTKSISRYQYIDVVEKAADIAKDYTDEKIHDIAEIYAEVEEEKQKGMYIYNGSFVPTANGYTVVIPVYVGDKFVISASTRGGYLTLQAGETEQTTSAVTAYVKDWLAIYAMTESNTLFDNVTIEIIKDGYLCVQNSLTDNFSVKKAFIGSFESAIDEAVKISKEYTDEKIATVSVTSPRIHIGSRLYAVVGDTLQIFKKSIVEGLNESEHIFRISCAKGKMYPRYFEYTPTASDVGTTDIVFEVYDKKGNLLVSKTSSLKTVSASNPTSAKNILCVGDSTTYGGEYPIELSRRLKGTSGVATVPAPLSLSNYNVVGRLNKNSVGWEGTGGWSFSTYISSGATAVRFHVANAESIGLGDIIQIAATNSTGYYRFQVEEVNVIGGSGELRCMFYQTPYASSFLSEVAASGELKKTNGETVGNYTSLSVETYQPFWNNSENRFDIASYVNTYCNGKCDYLFILLGINNLISMSPFASYFESVLDNCKTLLNNIHSQLPNAKILLSTNPLVSQNGGVGSNYNTNAIGGSFDESGWNHKLWEMNELYFSLEADTTFNSWVYVINTHAQVDSDNAYPVRDKALNVRSVETEKVGANAVHPSNDGYWMIADALLRAVLNN